MSSWTHVMGIVRISDVRVNDDRIPNFDKIFGIEVPCYEVSKYYDDMKAHPEKYLPFGSEGSLQKSIWINHNRKTSDAYTVSIFGVLRDYSTPQEIIKWFKEKIKNLYLYDIAASDASIVADCINSGERCYWIPSKGFPYKDGKE